MLPLPDDGAVGGVEPHLVAWLDVEGVKECVDVTQRCVDAVAANRVRVALGLLEDSLLGRVLRPDAAVAQVEALRRREPVKIFAIFKLLGLTESTVSDAQTALVGDVLAQRQVTIGVQVFHHG